MSFGPPEDSPLNTRDYSKLQEGLSLLNRARRKIDLAKQAGINCDDRESECDYLQQRIEAAKSVYFPHKP